mmetsp:Transcript_38381/g.68583  ORF Transcript_38381/g.68583 Transcript_38381/m.68583 type:complete len:244 (+) Transcript_38381:719-1450(+)
MLLAIGREEHGQAGHFIVNPRPDADVPIGIMEFRLALPPPLMPFPIVAAAVHLPEDTVPLSQATDKSALVLSPILEDLCYLAMQQPVLPGPGGNCVRLVQLALAVLQPLHVIPFIEAAICLAHFATPFMEPIQPLTVIHAAIGVREGSVPTELVVLEAPMVRGPRGVHHDAFPAALPCFVLALVALAVAVDEHPVSVLLVELVIPNVHVAGHVAVRPLPVHHVFLPVPLIRVPVGEGVQLWGL